MTSYKLSNDSKTRLETMVRTNDGFEIAEVDLKLRGPGDLMGTQQSGVLNLRIANIVKDKEILSLARHYANDVISSDSNLVDPLNSPIKTTYLEIIKNKNIWKYIS